MGFGGLGLPGLIEMGIALDGMGAFGGFFVVLFEHNGVCLLLDLSVLTFAV